MPIKPFMDPLPISLFVVSIHFAPSLSLSLCLVAEKNLKEKRNFGLLGLLYDLDVHIFLWVQFQEWVSPNPCQLWYKETLFCFLTMHLIVISIWNSLGLSNLESLILFLSLFFNALHVLDDALKTLSVNQRQRTLIVCLEKKNC